MSMIPPVSPPPPSVPPSANPRGSLGRGVGFAWAVFILGYIVAVTLATGLTPTTTVTPYVVLMLLPWIAMIALTVWLFKRGQSRTAQGVLIGIATILAVGLLLVAACFGLLAGTNFH